MVEAGFGLGKQQVGYAKILYDIVFFFIYCMLVAWPSGSERRFYDGHDRKIDGSTPTQASLLRPWIRCFTNDKLSVLGGI